MPVAPCQESDTVCAIGQSTDSQMCRQAFLTNTQVNMGAQLLSGASIAEFGLHINSVKGANLI